MSARRPATADEDLAPDPKSTTRAPEPEREDDEVEETFGRFDGAGCREEVAALEDDKEEEEEERLKEKPGEDEEGTFWEEDIRCCCAMGFKFPWETGSLPEVEGWTRCP